jgi:serine protease Do
MAVIDEQIISKIVKDASPAVISITASKDIPKIDGFYRMPYGKREFIVPKIKKGEKKRVKISGGSGFLISDDGILLTNSHVIADTKAEYSVFMDHEERQDKKHSIEVVARDSLHDIAICKIIRASGSEEKGKQSVHPSLKKLPYLKLGDSTNLELGQFVVAVGNALGEFSNTVSFGVISGLSRFITARHSRSRQTERLRGLIQTDAAINPGNSGGPLLNLEGEVIGINTAVIFGAQNIGFAIPINQAKKDIQEVKEYGRVRIPFLGIRYLILDGDLKEKNNLAVDYGALIVREALGDIAVVPGSCAEKARLKEFDIILETNDKKITPEFTLQDVLQEKQIGDELELKVLRGKKELKVRIKLEEKK